MKAVIVYESLWGNTAAIAAAIAEGLGPGAKALSTSEASQAALADADLIVAGAPTHLGRMPTAATREGVRSGKYEAKRPADVSHPPMREWLARFPQGGAACAAFDTTGCIPPEAPLARFWAKFGARNGIAKAMRRAGCRLVDEAQTFRVEAQEGPLRDGELERAKAWGTELARKLG